MKKSALALVLCLMLVLTVFAGCTPSEPTPGGNDNPPSGNDSQGGDSQGGTQAGEGEFAAGLTGTYKIMVAGEQAEDTIDPVTGGTIKGWKTIASEFVNQNPGVELQFVEVPWTDYIAKLQTAAQSGEFDVLHLAAGQNASSGNNGYLLSLNDYIEKDEKFDGEALYGKELWNSSNIYTDGNYYGLPKLGYTFMHLYNKQILDDFGVTD